MQPIIREYPNATFVLLHSSYPYSRDAGYLASVYQNVYADIGEVFPLLSRHGQCSVLSQLLEMTPIDKIMWSSKPQLMNLHRRSLTTPRRRALVARNVLSGLHPNP